MDIPVTDLKKGDKLICIANVGTQKVQDHVEVGGYYVAASDQQSSRQFSMPFITVVNDAGKHINCYAERFEKMAPKKVSLGARIRITCRTLSQRVYVYLVTK